MATKSRVVVIEIPFVWSIIDRRFQLFYDLDFGYVFKPFSEALEAPESMKLDPFATLGRTRFQVHAQEPPKNAPQGRFWDLTPLSTHSFRALDNPKLGPVIYGKIYTI